MSSERTSEGRTGVASDEPSPQGSELEDVDGASESNAELDVFAIAPNANPVLPPARLEETPVLLPFKTSADLEAVFSNASR